MLALASPFEAKSALCPRLATMRQSPKTIFVLLLVNVALNECIFRDLGVFHLPTANASRSSRYWLWCILIVRLLATGSLCTIWRIRNQPLSALTGSAPIDPYLPTPHALFPVLVNIALAMYIFGELLSGSHIESENNLWLSPVYFAQFGLQAYPLLTFFLLRDTPLTSVLLSWFVALGTLFACCVNSESPDAFMSLLVYAVASATVFYEHYRHNRIMFLATNALKSQLVENEKLALHARALELRAMIGNVAHDLKTPLTSFLSGTEHMEDIVQDWENDLLSDKKEKFLREAPQKIQALRSCLVNMNSTNSFMTMTINRCLDYTKAIKGIKLVPKLEAVDFRSKMQVCVHLIHDTHSHNNIQIRISPIDPSICTRVITDRQWLIENLMCLLSNVTKYSQHGWVDLSVELVPNVLLEASRNSDDANRPDADEIAPQCLRFQVLDTGVGLSEEAMQGLFNSFKQAQRLAGGTGLGLFSLARRVEALHGQYGVARRPDGQQGSMFWFTIPYRSAATRPVQSPSSAAVKFSPTARADSHSHSLSQNIPSTVSGWEHYRVMIVDDAPLVVKMVRMLLTGKGHKVEEKAVDGQEALEKLIHCYGSTEPPGEPPFDVVLMDLQMPVLDGIEAIRRLRAFERASQQQQFELHAGDGAGVTQQLHLDPEIYIPQPLAPICTAVPNTSITSKPFHQFVVAFSANSDHETKQAAMEAGADAFLSKPFLYDSFMEVVHGA